jgi:hypothetical protein
VRGIILRGATLTDMWTELVPLLAFFAAGLAVALTRFRKRLD